MAFFKKATRYGNAKTAIKQKLNAGYIKQTLSPRDFYRHELPGATFKQPGWNDGGLCPFHADSKPGSFRINLMTGAFKCFACGVSGADVIAFTMTMYGLKFVDSLAKLAHEWGLI